MRTALPGEGVQGVGPRTWWEAKQAKKAVRNAISIWATLLVLLGVVIILGRG